MCLPECFPVSQSVVKTSCTTSWPRPPFQIPVRHYVEYLVIPLIYSDKSLLLDCLTFVKKTCQVCYQKRRGINQIHLTLFFDSIAHQTGYSPMRTSSELGRIIFMKRFIYKAGIGIGITQIRRHSTIPVVGRCLRTHNNAHGPNHIAYMWSPPFTCTASEEEIIFAPHQFSCI